MSTDRRHLQAVAAARAGGGDGDGVAAGDRGSPAATPARSSVAPPAPTPGASPDSAPRDPLAPVVARARYMMGENVTTWPREKAEAWEGLLELAGRLRREAGARLETHENLSVSMLGVLGRLATADRRTLRQNELADAMGLSVSRMSRIIDVLERRALVARRVCPTDRRATNVTLTDAGMTLAHAAQDEVFAFVEHAFFGALAQDEVEALAAVFRRLLEREA